MRLFRACPSLARCQTALPTAARHACHALPAAWLRWNTTAVSKALRSLTAAAAASLQSPHAFHSVCRDAGLF